MRRLVLQAIALFTGLVLLAFVAAPSQAANTRVSITDFKWSQSPQIDLGESVTWDWLGPDLQHSVTGQGANASGWDSDPTISMPVHPLGDSYKVTFDQPGQYLFACKLHSSVRGTVVVSNTLGNPDSDPGPQAPLNFDMEVPYVDAIALEVPVFGPKGKGSPLAFSVNERGYADADYYKLVKRGKRTKKVFTGYSVWTTYIGENLVPLAKRSKTFKAKPGKYEAQFRVTDEHANTTEPYKIQFEILGPAKKKKKAKK